MLVPARPELPAAIVLAVLLVGLTVALLAGLWRRRAVVLLAALLVLGVIATINWRNFSDLFRCQTKLRAKPLFHSVAHSPWMVNIKENMPSIKSTQSSASDSASDEYKDKSGDKFPL